MIEAFVPEHIRSLTPYPPGKPLSELERELGVSKAIKLASNENALGPSPKAMQAIQEALPDLHRYPDGGGFYLRDALSKHLGINGDQLVLGNGSNEIIELLLRTFLTTDSEVLTSETTFVVYRLITQAAGAHFVPVPMRDYGFDLNAIADRVTEKTRIIFLCNPNNPTGTMFSQSSLDRFLQRVGDDPILVLDEAYIEFVAPHDRIDAIEVLKRRPRTLILRTFSKAYGLAGLRLGYGISSPDLADYMNRVRQPFNTNHLAQVAAKAALGDHDYLQRVLQLTEDGKRSISNQLREMGLSVVDSHTNFVLFDCGRDAKPIYEALLQMGIIVRPMTAYGLPTHLRVNMGLPEENERFLQGLRQAL